VEMRDILIIILIIVIIVLALILLLEIFGIIDIIPGLGEPGAGGDGFWLDFIKQK
jgi:hypothetical protein